MLLNEGKFLNTENFARHLYNHLMKIPEMHMEGEEFSHVRPFRQWPELYDEFYELVLPYKGKTALPFNELMKKVKGEFLVRYKYTHEEDEEVVASIVNFQMTIYQDFFDIYKKRERIETLSHELMHMIQFMFPHTPEDETEKDYYHQPYEIEAISKDIVYEMRLKIRRGKIHNQYEAKNFLINHKNFKKFPPKFKRKMMKKILLDLFYYNPPVNESLNEAKYLKTGELPEIIYQTIYNALKHDNFPFNDKDGIKILRKTLNKQQSKRNYKIELPLFNNRTFKEFEKLLDVYNIVDKDKLNYFKENFTLVIEPNRTEDAIAIVDENSITVSKDFFKFNKEEQLLVLHHEATHMLQIQFPIFAGTYYQKLGTPKAKYEKDPLELQAYGSELTKEIASMIKKDVIKDMGAVSEFVKEHPFYKSTSLKYKSKLLRKILANIKSEYRLPDRFDNYLESLNELKMPSTKLTDDELIDKILLRKQTRKETVEHKFLLIFFDILRGYNISPEVFINRYHKYVSDEISDSISIEDIMQFLRFVGKSKEHSKVAKVLRISTNKIEYLKNKFETKLLTPIKKIYRHDSSDKTYAGLHFTDTKKRYNSMLIKNIQKADKVQTLKENYNKSTALFA